jgi:hypothetical protein
VQPLSAAVPEDDGVVAPPATTSWTDNDPAPALGSHQTYGIGETYGAPVPAADNDADAPTPGAPAAYGPASSFTPAPTTFPAPEVPAQAHGSGAYPVVGGSGAYPTAGGSGAYPTAGGSGAYPVTGGSGAYPVAGSSGAYPVSGESGAYPVAGGSGAYPTAGGSGAYPVTSPFGAPEAGLASGVGAAGVASETDPETATDLGTAARAGEANAYGADAAGVADVAGAVAEPEPEPYGAPSELAADLLDDPDAAAAHEPGVTSASASPMAPAPTEPASPPATHVTPASYATPTIFTPPADRTMPATRAPSATPAPSVTHVPSMAPVPRVARVVPGPAVTRPSASTAKVESTPVPALIGDQLRTPMVWCELEPGNCVSWHADRAALGVADVRARAIAAGWRIDALGRLTCPQCQQRSATFRATQQVVLWDRAYALTMAAREAARQGGYAYPQPAFYPR